MLYRIAQFLIYRFFKYYYGMRVTGVENLPSKGGYILAVNHQSFFDPPLAACPVPYYVSFMARNTLWKSRFFRLVEFLLRDIIPIKRGAPDRAALKEAARRLKDGWVVLLFPEATRTRDGSLNPLKKGPAFISLRVGAPIVPAVIKGAFEIWPRGRKVPSLRPRPFKGLKVAYGEPIYPGDYEAYSGKERNERISRILEFRMHELFNLT